MDGERQAGDTMLVYSVGHLLPLDKHTESSVFLEKYFKSKQLPLAQFSEL